MVIGHWSRFMDNRKRIWAFIAYPDSVPENWQSILASQYTPICISPLHDSDLNGDDTDKKPHWHVLVAFSGKKTEEQAQQYSDCVHGTKVQPVNNIAGYVRYFIHIDNPEKTPYKKEDIINLCGFNSDQYFAPSQSTVSQIMNEIQQFIVDNTILEYEDLYKYAAQNEDWLYVLNMYHCNSIMRLINSMRNRRLRSNAIRL